MFGTKVDVLEKTLTDRKPFCQGVCAVPQLYQLLFHYTHDTVSQIDFAHATTEELEDFFRACQPASFALNNKDVFDETYRKAGKMDLDTFSTLFDPRSLGIHDVIEQELLSSNQAVELELYKLNVYGKGGFFKAHQDTPRGDSMFGTLVVILPAPHQGGQLSLRANDHQWIVDFTDQFATATEPSVCFVAFFGDIEHEVLPVISGYRVTLTYNLYFRIENNIPRILPGPFHDDLKRALVELVNDPETLPEGGYLGIGLCHQYSYDETKPIDSLIDKLKGSDAALVNVCKELGLPCSLKLLYAHEAIPEDFTLLSHMKLGGLSDLKTRRTKSGRIAEGYDEADISAFLARCVHRLTPNDLEGVKIVGRKYDDEWLAEEIKRRSSYHFMKKFYKNPVTQVLEVKKMSSVLCESLFGFYGNEISVEGFYGSASMVISVKPTELREHLVV